VIINDHAVSGGVFFALVTACIALVLVVVHMQSIGHGGSLGAVYRNEATIDAMRAQIGDVNSQLADVRRRLRVLGGEDVPGDLPLPRLPGVPPIPRRPAFGSGGSRNWSTMN
jgi:hypothetical protein